MELRVKHIKELCLSGKYIYEATKLRNNQGTYWYVVIIIHLLDNSTCCNYTFILHSLYDIVLYTSCWNLCSIFVWLIGRMAESNKRIELNWIDSKEENKTSCRKSIVFEYVKHYGWLCCFESGRGSPCNLQKKNLHACNWPI